LERKTTAAEREARAKLLTRKAVLSDPQVVAIGKRIRSAEVDLQIEQANNKQLSRQFAGECHIAELKAAKMQMTSRGVTR
jgi:hypothetical protein